RSPVPAPLPAGPRQFSAIAWPASGIASNEVLAGLATQRVGTVILAAPVSPVSYTPGAVSSNNTLIGVRLNVLLADNAITALLGSRPAASATPADVFQVSQRYLAETAMIASEQPSNRRPIMIAPPRRWDPSRELARNLLADTVAAPWLQPSTAGQMVSQPAEHVYTGVVQNPSPAELPAKLLRDVSRLDHRIELLQSIRVQPDPGLNRAVFAIESSAWRGKGVRHARALLEQTNDYVNRQLQGVTIQSGGGHHRAYRVTLGGKTGSVPLAIHSDLRYPVRVSLRVASSHAVVKGVPGSIVVPPLGYSRAVKLNVHVKGDQASIKLTLVAPPHSRLADHPLPASPLAIRAHPTDFGTVALVLFAAVLALFVVGSAARTIKHGRPEPPAEANDLDAPTQPPAPDEQTRTTPTEETLHLTSGAGHHPPGGPGAPTAPAAAPVRDAAWPAPERGKQDPPASSGAAVRGRAGHQEAGAPSGSSARRPSPSGWVTPPDLPTEGDTPDGIRAEGFLKSDNRPEYADSVGTDRSELTSAGPSVSDQEPRRTTEERR
ncbi:MAG: DUF6049 family protein, partial [Streptosporangiaceae bacterium]